MSITPRPQVPAKMAKAPVSSSHHPPRPPAIALPPHSSAENIFSSGFACFSPGPMTLASLFAADSRSFSQLLAGAMTSPAAPTEKEDSKYKQNRPLNLEVSAPPLFMVPPGFSPSGMLNSPGIFSPVQSPFGMSHQQALAQVTAQAALAQSTMQTQAGNNQTPLVNPPGSYKPPSTMEPKIASIAPSEVFQSGPKSQPPTVAPDKLVDDGYDWRKYGQKQVKGSEYPRSYYKCTHFRCPVKKKVEQSPEGQIVEIIYKGQHNHEQSPPRKPAKDANDPIGSARSQAMPDVNQLDRSAVPKRPMEAAPEQIDHEKNKKFHQETSVVSRPLSTDETRGNANSDNGPMLKKRNTGSTIAEPNLPQKTVVEPKIIVQTRSEVDLLDDGFRWRKYGQKALKGNSNRRSYYKCTTPGCNARKRVERASTDPKAVITTYEGKHNHDVQGGRSNIRNISSGSPQQKSRIMTAEKHTLRNKIQSINNGQTNVAVLQSINHGQTDVAVL